MRQLQGAMASKLWLAMHHRREDLVAPVGGVPLKKKVVEILVQY
jgi:hypothetical protein